MWTTIVMHFLNFVSRIFPPMVQWSDSPNNSCSEPHMKNSKQRGVGVYTSCSIGSEVCDPREREVDTYIRDVGWRMKKDKVYLCAQIEVLSSKSEQYFFQSWESFDNNIICHHLSFVNIICPHHLRGALHSPKFDNKNNKKKNPNEDWLLFFLFKTFCKVHGLILCLDMR